MNKRFTYLWPVIFAVACHNTPTEQKPADSVITATAPLVASGNQALDTFTLAGKTCIVYPEAVSPFGKERVKKEETPEELEQRILARDTSVKRVGDTLFLPIDNGNPVAMGNNNEDDGDAYVKFFYEGFMPEINCYCIRAGYYEGGDYVLLNRTTGTNIHVWGKPLMSPDKKQLICTSYDLEAGFIPNGYQLLGYNNGKLEVLGEATLDEWGPGQVQWLDNNTLVAEHVKPDLTGKGGDMVNEIKQIVKIVIQ